MRGYSGGMHAPHGNTRHQCPRCAARHTVRVPLHVRPLDNQSQRHMRVLARFNSAGILLELTDTDTDLPRCAARRGWRAVSAPPTISEGHWRAGSFDAVILCNPAERADDLLHLAAHYCRLDGLLLIELPTHSRDDVLHPLALHMSRHGFRLCLHGCLPGDDPGDALLTVVARYVP